jgi:cytochrome c peroxidase
MQHWRDWRTHFRNFAASPLTAPYFHDGSVPLLPEAVKVMARVQLGVTLSATDVREIVAFLESLTGDLASNFATVPTLPSGSIVPKQ